MRRLSDEERDRFIAAWNGGTSMGEMRRLFHLGDHGIRDRVHRFRRKGYDLVRRVRYAERVAR